MIALDIEGKTAGIAAMTESADCGVREIVLDPFAMEPQWMSKIVGLGGRDAPADPSYVFRTAPVRPPLGPIDFVIRFQNLQATAGTLVLQVSAISEFPGSNGVPIETVTLPMAGLLERGGECRIELTSRRNMLYGLAAEIHDDTDAVADALVVTLQCRGELDSRPEPIPWGKARNSVRHGSRNDPPEGGMETVMRLLNLEPPSLMQPVSQGWTPEQCGQAPFMEWVSALGPDTGAPPENWEIAYVLQVLRRYGALRMDATGLGFGAPGRHPLPSLLASQGCTVLAAARHGDDLPDNDPGLALEELHWPQICSPTQFFDRAHLTVVDVSALPAELSGFDFMWSIRMSDGMETVAEYQSFVEGAINCLRPGGLAVHLFRQAHFTGKLDHGAFALSRPDIERMALWLIALGHEVAQLKFGYHNKASLNGHSEIPFGMIARRAEA